MLKKRIFAIICSMFITSNLFAYSFTEDFLKGFYWEVFPVKIKVLMDSRGVATNLFALTKQAEAQWELEANINLWDIESVSTYNSTDNVVRWSDKFAQETGYDPYSTLAVTVRYSQGTNMVKTQIIINSGVSYLVQNFASMLDKTVLHEMGHTIGLGHSEDSIAIMAPMIGETKVLEDDDRMGLADILEETLDRQQNDFVSQYSEPLTKVSSPALGNCGGVAYAGEVGSNNAESGFLLSAIFGIFIGILFKIPGLIYNKQNKRKNIHHRE